MSSVIGMIVAPQANAARTSDGADILLVGGYGVVGRRVAARLAPHFPGRVIIAGRDEERAAAFCRDLGHGARYRRVDVDVLSSIAPALDGVRTVLASPRGTNGLSFPLVAYSDLIRSAFRRHSIADSDGIRSGFRAFDR